VNAEGQPNARRYNITLASLAYHNSDLTSRQRAGRAERGERTGAA